MPRVPTLRQARTTCCCQDAGGKCYAPHLQLLAQTAQVLPQHEGGSCRVRGAGVYHHMSSVAALLGTRSVPKSVHPTARVQTERVKSGPMQAQIEASPSSPALPGTPHPRKDMRRCVYTYRSTSSLPAKETTDLLPPTRFASDLPSPPDLLSLASPNPLPLFQLSNQNDALNSYQKGSTTRTGREQKRISSYEDY